MRYSRGLSVLEVQLAFLVMIVVILALLGLVPGAARQSATSSSYTRALYTATQAMEGCLQRNTEGDTGSLAAPEVAPSAFVRWSTSAGLNANTQRVLVEVTWIEQNRPMRVELVSLIYQ